MAQTFDTWDPILTRIKLILIKPKELKFFIKKINKIINFLKSDDRFYNQEDFNVSKFVNEDNT